jgi:hypothetical protein
VAVFLVQHKQHFLGDILGGFPLNSRCRETQDPFAQAFEDGAWFHLLSIIAPYAVYLPE